MERKGEYLWKKGGNRKQNELLLFFAIFFKVFIVLLAVTTPCDQFRDSTNVDHQVNTNGWYGTGDERESTSVNFLPR